MCLFLTNLEIPIVVTSIVSITSDIGGHDKVYWIIASYMLGYVGELSGSFLAERSHRRADASGKRDVGNFSKTQRYLRSQIMPPGCSVDLHRVFGGVRRLADHRATVCRINNLTLAGVSG